MTKPFHVWEYIESDWNDGPPTPHAIDDTTDWYSAADNFLATNRTAEHDITLIVHDVESNVYHEVRYERDWKCTMMGTRNPGDL